MMALLLAGCGYNQSLRFVSTDCYQCGDYAAYDVGCPYGTREQWYGPHGRVVPSYARYAIDFDCVPVGPADRRAFRWKPPSRSPGYS
jgi:hypothetical protein